MTASAPQRIGRGVGKERERERERVKETAVEGRKQAEETDSGGRRTDGAAFSRRGATALKRGKK